MQKSLVRASASDRDLDFLTRRVISGPSAESEGDEKLHNFLLALEGRSQSGAGPLKEVRLFGEGKRAQGSGKSWELEAYTLTS